MKKILILSALLLGGCATVPSEYHQGCQDGIMAGATSEIKRESLIQHCNYVEQRYRQRERALERLR